MPIMAASESMSSVPASAALGLRSAPKVPPSSEMEGLPKVKLCPQWPDCGIARGSLPESSNSLIDSTGIIARADRDHLHYATRRYTGLAHTTDCSSNGAPDIISTKSHILRRFSLTSTKIFVYFAGQSSVEGPAVRIVRTGLSSESGIPTSDPTLLVYKWRAR